jgi:ubiquitin carboxyl-terminal hydrolase 4/11/15
MVSEVYKNKFYRHYEDYMPVGEISSGDYIVAYELDEIPTSWPGPINRKPRSMVSIDEEPDNDDSAESERILVPVFLKRPSQRRYGEDYIGMPFFVTYSREEARDYYAVVAKVVDRLQFLTTRDLYAPAPAQVAEEEDYDAVASTSETKETSDEEKDGFVDVSMKDATSSESIEVDSEPEPITLATSTVRKAPQHIADLFTIKLNKQHRDERLPTGFSTLNADLDIMDRFEPTPVQVSSQQPRQSALFGSITAARSGRGSPVSQASDDDADLYKVAPTDPQEDMMQDSSEDEGAYSSTDMSAFQPPSEVPATSFYGSGPPSANDYTSPPRSLLMSHEPSPLVCLGEAMILEFTEEGCETLFDGKHSEDFRGVSTWDNFPVVEDPELARRRHKREQKRNRGLHLEDCLDEFAKEEVLSAEDPWYCPRCKKHRRASKKFELWKCPDILVIHLKRFSSSRSLRDKIDAKIDCPIEGLDLSERVGLKEDKPMLYDLIAVDNHYGGLGGGHYTASVKNWFDGKWYYCDGEPSFFPFILHKLDTDGKQMEASVKPTPTPSSPLLRTSSSTVAAQSTPSAARNSRKSSPRPITPSLLLPPPLTRRNRT